VTDASQYHGVSDSTKPNIQAYSNTFVFINMHTFKSISVNWIGNNGTSPLYVSRQAKG